MASDKNRFWEFVEMIRSLIATQIENMQARASSPPLTGIHLIQDEYPPAKLVDHPGYGSHEEIEPMK